MLRNQTLAHIQLAFITLLTIIFLWATLPASAHAATTMRKVPVCMKVALPGPEHVINPHAPVRYQIRDTETVCAMEEFPDPSHVSDHYQPITDFAHDSRAIA